MAINVNYEYYYNQTFIQINKYIFWYAPIYDEWMHNALWLVVGGIYSNNKRSDFVFVQYQVYTSLHTMNMELCISFAANNSAVAPSASRLLFFFFFGYPEVSDSWSFLAAGCWLLRSLRLFRKREKSVTDLNSSNFQHRPAATISLKFVVSIPKQEASRIFEFQCISRPEVVQMGETIFLAACQLARRKYIE